MGKSPGGGLQGLAVRLVQGLHRLQPRRQVLDDAGQEIIMKMHRRLAPVLALATQPQDDVVRLDPDLVAGLPAEGPEIDLVGKIDADLGAVGNCFHFAASLLFSAVLIFALLAPPALANGPNVAAGRAFAEAKCAECHAVAATGDSPKAEAPPFRRLDERFPVAALAEALAEGITTGHPAMPEFTLTPGEIDDFIAFLESLAAE